jgi:DNA-binding beta-propeller fold protein YncE
VLSILSVQGLPSLLPIDATAGRVLVLVGMARPGQPSLYLLDATSGRVIGTGHPSTLSTGRAGTFYTAVANQRSGYIAFSGDGGISLVDCRSGRLLRLWPDRPRAHLLLVDGRRDRLVAIDQDGSIGVLSAQASWTQTAPIVVAKLARDAALDERTGRVFLLSADPSGDHARIVVVDPRTGVVLRAEPVGRGPIELAVDDTAQRVITLSFGDDATFGQRAGPVSESWWLRWVRSWLPRLAPAPPLDERYGSIGVFNEHTLAG